MTWIRALAAAGLSIILPGAGHALLRDWARAAIFAGLFISASVIFLPHDQLLTAASNGAYGEFPAILEAETSILEQFTLSFLALFAAIDAGFQALGLTQGPTTDDGAASCPHCGKGLDEDLTFCHWCTTPLQSEDDEPTHS